MKKCLVLMRLLAIGFAVSLLFTGCGEATPLKVTKRFFALVEKGDVMSLHEYATSETVEHIVWLEQGGATKTKQASSQIFGTMFGSMLGMATGFNAVDSAANSLIGGNVGGMIGGALAGGDEEAKYPMCRRGLIARGRIVSVKEIFRVANGAGNVFAVVAVNFKSGATENIVLGKWSDAPDKPWQVSNKTSEYLKNRVSKGASVEDLSIWGADARSI